MAKANALFYGDNLVWLHDQKYFPNESVDLIYLDPPFNSKADYNLIFNEPGKLDKSQAQIKAFDDTWHWESEASAIALNELAQNKPQIAELISWLSRQGKPQESIAAYLAMMAIRLIELHRILKSTGSIYLHCDPTASHYLKLLMDLIFGGANFQNDIVWCFRERERPIRKYNPKHNDLLYYVKDINADFTFNDLDGSTRFSQGTLGKFQYLDDKGRRFQIRGKNVKGSPYAKDQGLSLEIEKENPDLVYRDYLDKATGVSPRDWLAPPMGNPKCPKCQTEFTDNLLYFSNQEQASRYPMAPLNRAARERLGYPTQKPQGLLEYLVRISSKKNDVILDPFCGCGTTIVTAQKLGRNWLGIDVTWLAIDLVEKRLKAIYGSKIAGKYEVHGKSYDITSAQALAKKSKKEFEIWAVTSVGAAPREHDGGVDGIMGFVEKNKKIKTILVQVKGGDVLNPGMVRDLIGTVKKEGAAIGLMITLKEPTYGMNTLAVHSDPYKSELWNKEFPSIQIRTIGELFTGKAFDLPPTKSILKSAKLAKEEGQQISQEI